MRKGDFYTSIGEGRTIELMLALKDSDDMAILKDLTGIINHSQSLRSRLDRMEEEGLVNILVIKEPRKQVRVWLTDLGRDVALMFGMVNSLVSPKKGIRDKGIDMNLSDPILRMMHGRDYIVQKELVSELRSYATIVRAISRMEEDGLITITENRDSYREVRYSLTPLGEQVAEVYQAVFEKICLERRLSDDG